MNHKHHISQEDLEKYLLGKLEDEREVEEIFNHLSECRKCYELVSQKQKLLRDFDITFERMFPAPEKVKASTVNPVYERIREWLGKTSKFASDIREKILSDLEKIKLVEDLQYQVIPVLTDKRTGNIRFMGPETKKDKELLSHAGIDELMLWYTSDNIDIEQFTIDLSRKFLFVKNDSKNFQSYIGREITLDGIDFPFHTSSTFEAGYKCAIAKLDLTGGEELQDGDKGITDKEGRIRQSKRSYWIHL